MTNKVVAVLIAPLPTHPPVFKWREIKLICQNRSFTHVTCKAAQLELLEPSCASVVPGKFSTQNFASLGIVESTMWMAPFL